MTETLASIALMYAAMMVALGSPGLITTKAVLVVITGALLVVAAPLIASPIICLATILLIAMPLQLKRMSLAMLVARRTRPSLLLSRTCFLCHPDRFGRAQLDFAKALALTWRQGSSYEAIEAFARVARQASSPETIALAALFHQRRLQEQLDQFVDEVVWSRHKSARATMFRFYALSTVGRVDELIDDWRRCCDRPESRSTSAFQLDAKIQVLAAAGRVDALERVLESASGQFPPDLRDLLLTRAAIAAGTAGPSVCSVLARLARSDDRDVASEAMRLAVRPPVLVSLSIEQQVSLDAAAMMPDARSDRLVTPVTLWLMTFCLGGFAMQLLTGGAIGSRLLQGAGLVPPLVLTGEWWRLATALFLHNGWVHLLIDLAMLAVIGTAAERRFGGCRMLIIFGVAGIGAMGGLVTLYAEGAIANYGIVGASGAVMGLCGAMLGSALISRRRGSAGAPNGGVWILLILLQFALDWPESRISFADHALGAAIGLLLGTVFSGAGAAPVKRPAPSIAPARGRMTRARAGLALATFLIAATASIALPLQRARALHPEAQPSQGSRVLETARAVALDLS